jgi:hypothetical protein
MDTKSLFQVVEGFNSPAPEVVKTNDMLNEKLNWFVLEDRTHAVGILNVDFDAKPRDLLLECDKKIVYQLFKPESRLVIRNTLESRFLRLTECIYKHIHHTVDKYGLDHHKICYMSSNINEHKAYNRWCSQNRIVNKIQVFGVVGWWEFSLNNYTQYDRSWHTDFKAKKFICLNRRIHDAPHRKSVLYHLYRLGQINHGLVSSTGYEDNDLAVAENWDRKFYAASCRPRIVDIDAGSIGAGPAADRNTADLHRLTGFSIVTESSWDNDGGTHRFYTEKTLRAALYGHPFLIIGEAGANTDLVRLGLEPYTELWDIGTDFIAETDARIGAQLESIRWDLAASTLHTQNREKIKHNRDAVMQNLFNRRQLQKIAGWALNV